MSAHAPYTDMQLAIRRYNYSCSIAAAVLLIYDYLITFDREVELFWANPKKTAAPLLFYATRYLGLLSVILTRVKATPRLSLEVCVTLVKVGSVVEWLQAVPVGVFAGLRFFALSKGNWTISLIVFGLSSQRLRRHRQNHVAEGDYVVTIVTNAAIVFANVIIIAVTWKTLGARSIRRLLSRDMHRGFTAILLWNGTIYFIALSLLAIIHVIFTMTSIFYGGVGSALSLLGPPLTSILVWRFMIALQATNQSNIKIGSDDPLHLATDAGGSLSFARAIGSIGAIVTSESLELQDENDCASVDPEKPLDMGGEFLDDETGGHAP
ncbi:hypothetical protein OH76DRAFT_319312 [Lentinus brumalis]|uniref:DUF6533 domain-containing protein n=1 Tax=Lentinus brumalis TaxID=2498619 RepID=A0A371DFH0_9APHY|nr:hypothetical protein OH76DRAFT_319312 [Polyporus brumalis]